MGRTLKLHTLREGTGGETGARQQLGGASRFHRDSRTETYSQNLYTRLVELSPAPLTVWQALS